MIFRLNDALREVLTKEEAAFPELEKYLDKEISKGFDGQRVVIPLKGFGWIRRETLEKFLDRYRAAGWKAVYQHYDDGNLTFSFLKSS